MMRISDIAAIAKIAHDAGALLVVDNTFASPYLQQPLDLGADVVVHSTTKYIGGHSDVVGGAIVVKDPVLAEAIGFIQFAVGAVSGADGRLPDHPRAEDPGRAHAHPLGKRDGRGHLAAAAARRSRQCSTRAWKTTRATSWPRRR